MNRNIKKVLSLVLVLVLSLSAFAGVYAAGNEVTEIGNVNDGYELITTTDFMLIYEGVLHEECADTPVYCVACRGLDFVELDMSKPRSLLTVVRSIFSDESNPYLLSIVEAVSENVPQGSNIVFIGHSLGGMVIQQAMANEELKDNYNILYAVALGSPYIKTSEDKEGTLVRFCDRRDPVAYLSIPSLLNPYLGDRVIYGSSRCSLLMVHFTSYKEGSFWLDYDILGVKDGNSGIELLNLVCEP